MRIIFILILIYCLLKFDKKMNAKSFNEFNIKRELDKIRVFENERFNIKTTIENNKRLPLSFIYVREKLPTEFVKMKQELQKDDNGFKVNISRYTMRSYERKIRNTTFKSSKRGIYTISHIKVTIGDIFGFSNCKKEFIDYLELIVYPEVKKLSQFKFSSNTLYGDNIVKRWIYKDPIYIKGIREYNTNDRMKDIHWASSAKMNRLMVREYDHTSEKQLIMLLNVESGRKVWRSGDEIELENAISLVASLASECSNLNINTGFWTNAQIIGKNKKGVSEVICSEYSLGNVLEMCARIYPSKKMNFSELLSKKKNEFKRNYSYIILGFYLDKESINMVQELVSRGISIAMMDVSSDLRLPNIKGVKKFDFKGAIR